MSEGSVFNTVVTADPSSFERGMDRMAEAAATASGKVQSSVNGVADVFERMQKPLAIIGAMLAGGAGFKEAIGVANRLNGEATKLSKSLGITGEEAAALRTALGDIGSDSDTYIGAFQKFAGQLRKNEDGLRAMGLETRDANGNLRDSKELFTEALGAVGQYKPGLDQTTAAMTFFGKSVDEAMQLQKLNNSIVDDAREKNRQLGTTLTKEGVQATREYKAAMNDVGDVMEAVENQIGKAVMPIFTELGNYFAQSGPYVVNVFKGALTGLVAAFRVVQGAVQTVAGVIFETISLVVDGAGMMGDVLSKLMSGDFSGAMESAKGLGARIGQAFKGALANFVEVGNDVDQKVRQDFDRIWGEGTEVGAPKGGKGRMGDFGKTNGEGKAQSAMPELEAGLEALRVATTQRGMIEGQYRELSKAEEAKYWNEIKARQDLSVADRATAAKKASEAEMAVNKQVFELRVADLQTEEAQIKNNADRKREIQKQIQAMYQEGTKEYEAASKRIAEIDRQELGQKRQVKQIQTQMQVNAAMSALAIEEQSAQQSQQLGLLTQQELLAAQVAFENRRIEIAREANKERLVYAKDDPVEAERLHADLQQLEQQHQLKIGQIRGAMQQNTLAPVENVFKATENSINASINGILNKSMTLRQGIQGVMQGITQSVVSETGKQLSAIAMAWVRKRFFTTTEIAADAAKAGSGAAASQAAIPIVGPGLAAAAMAATFASVIGMSAKVPSAQSGWKVPKGVNPLTQIHEEEMVLPSGPTKTLEHLVSLFEGGQLGGAGGGGGHTFYINAMDPRSFEQFLKRGAVDSVVRALDAHARNGG
ncbi:MAG: hypothetical protein RI907_4018 [Pseudomonadota bacterium]